jgi:acyl-CoA thioesterase-1
MARSIRIWRWLVGVLALTFALAAPTLAEAQVAAYGASNVQGYGVKPSEAYPAQLQAMLRAKGIKATVRNLGVFGVTSEQMLQRHVSAIPKGTKIVILDASGEFLNVYLHGIGAQQGQANLAEMVSRPQARGITVIQESTQDIPMSERQADGKHLTPEGHREVAARLVDQAAAALSR